MALTQQQTEELRTAIDGRRAALISDLHRGTDRVRDGDRRESVAGPVPDPGDESVATLLADLDHADISRDLAELRSLEAARERMAAGSYGVCADCGGEIPFERLRASPGAERCIRCQEQYEKTHASAPRASL